MEDLKYWVGLSGWEGFGRNRLEFLLKHFGSVQKIWEAGPDLNRQWQNNKDLDKEMERQERYQIRAITIEDKRYPKLLKEIDFAPFILFIKGSIEVLNRPGITVVGTRKMTEYGRQVTGKLVRELAKKLTIFSGLARGVDGWAHRVCLGVGGKTVAVLGHGLERIYPPEHAGLAEEIISHGGALVSEFPLDYQLNKQNFPRRDRILAGLTLGTLVIEGGEKSGTKITAGFAADYGREVFCVPGPIDSPTAAGPALLIQQGAKLVTGVEDIYEELNLN
ncbi:DNA-protecting protein DprA [Candidatus Beckwithbacteria bacterium CG23_combo_of_CG06-09_8_20_14_all_47_9]|uniref:DNA-protecting protein DprA n=3 Tax=Candidatus Beckwithiibacteriota TaxID=1752726 RepID=A0A2H0B3K5_9BACT|nr:MAG: DNA-protecting protein DprA [Candidatus Beckwithbacteria bacterium CG23_combo_of_CG06-09_8_20_14_all_47_9]